MRKKRRHSETCTPMPDMLSACHVASVMQWPLGGVMLRKAAGQGWTDCLIEFVDAIRTGGRYRTRRVRYDGRFYITWNKRRVYLVGELAWDVWETVQHVYGLDVEDDKTHSKRLKGY